MLLRIWAEAQTWRLIRKRGQKFDSSIVPLQNNQDYNPLYIAFDKMFKDNQHGLVDIMLSRANVETFDQQAMIAYLDATLHEKGKLKSREGFFKRCSEELDRRKETRLRRFSRLA